VISEQASFVGPSDQDTIRTQCWV